MMKSRVFGHYHTLTYDYETMMALLLVLLLLPQFHLAMAADDPQVVEIRTVDDVVVNRGNSTPVTNTCEAFFTEYRTHAGQFSLCELDYSEPFRMCNQCVQYFALASADFHALVTDHDLHDCRIRYMKSDRVQIIPSVQRNMENIWTKASCKGCYKNLSINHTTEEVLFDTPLSVQQFMELYVNLSLCMNATLEAYPSVHPVSDPDHDVCKICLKNYRELNHHYTDMTDEFGGDVCMDIVDRMNYTRLIWSHTFNCSCRSGDPVSVIAITLVVASTPLLFYIILRVTGKEKKQRVQKQKRLNASMNQSTVNSGGFYQTLWRPNNYRGYQAL